ncbi:CHAP domain-containing protein [Streptomyces sp. APSN-46.1]|uniref:CHAP domain-containing protein n=1 Tax=Streptomyces sp. APSN-46.1 TaxID=2929049 RepID=UPI001FB4396A|nr:CHAP domain-containing protein [Streptomyces sp. APSN-46.1]MCJ1677700.1 CHAP domain-containing protein [Streptomyces sp. APSN-46.1]
MSARRTSRTLSIALAAFVAAPLMAVLPSTLANAESQTVASIARGEVGGTCSDYNCQNPTAWCAEFVRWVWNQAGADVSGVTPAAVSLYTYGGNKGTRHSTPQVGDAVLYDKDGSVTDGNADHVNIVVAVSGDEIQTVGGNESGGVRFRGWFNWRTHSSPVGAGRALAFIGPSGLSETPSVPVSQAGDLFHATRLVNGDWESFQPLNGVGGAAFFNAKQESITATPDGSTQTLATGNDGNLYHTARYPDGSWTGWAPLDGYQGAATFGAKAQTIAGMGNGDAQVMAVGNDGKIYHNARFVSGSWQGWVPVGDWGAQKIAAAGLPNGSMQSLIVGNDGNVYHNVRSVDGTWQGWFAVDGFGGAATFQGKDVAVAGMPNGDAQFLATGTDGTVYHNIRFANGTWQGWSKTAGVGGATTFAASSIGITGMPNGDTQILAVGNDGKAYHSARYAGGQWQGWWNTGMGAQKVGIAGLGNGEAQMLVTRS